MPAITSRAAVVLVSGANGYIGMWVARTLLERGYTVRGSVRNAAKAAFVQAYFAARGYEDTFETIIVEDIAAEDVFDEAVRGVDAIVHTASPINASVKSANGMLRVLQSPPQLVTSDMALRADFVQSAVQGTLGILSSALKNGTQVKRVVITSSCAAIATPSSDPAIFSESDWDEEAPRDLEVLGDQASLGTGYLASKSLAEKAAWRFVETHISEIAWDLVVINPPFVFGPAIQNVASMESFNVSMQIWVDMLTAATPKSHEELLSSESWVDIRDASLGHVLALERPEAGGERIIVAAGPFIWQEWLDVANALPSNPLMSRPLNAGDPGVMDGCQKYMVSYDTSKESRILGIKYRNKLQTTSDSLEDMARRGW